MINNFKNRPQNFIEQYSTILIVAFWILMQSLLLYFYGIETGGESMKAILEAENLIKGNGLSFTSTFFYLTEILLIYLNLKIGVGYWFVVSIQLAVNLVALLYFFKFLESFTQSRLIAFAGAILLICCVPYQQYNSFLYTESIFFSLSIIYSCFLIACKKITLKKVAIIVGLLSLLCITRPSGIFFVAATIIYLFFQATLKMNFWKKIILFSSFTAIALVLLNAMMGAGGRIDILLPFNKQMIICEVPTNILGLKNTPLKTDNSISGLLDYILQYPQNFFRLSLLKLKAFFGLVRPYYSTSHNIILATYFYSLYLCIFLLLLRKIKQLPVAFVYFFAIIIIFALSVVLSCDEWGNRFFMTITPFLIVAALYLFVRPKESSI